MGKHRAKPQPSYVLGLFEGGETIRVGLDPANPARLSFEILSVDDSVKKLLFTAEEWRQLRDLTAVVQPKRTRKASAKKPPRVKATGSGSIGTNAPQPDLPQA